MFSNKKNLRKTENKNILKTIFHFFSTKQKLIIIIINIIYKFLLLLVYLLIPYVHPFFFLFSFLKKNYKSIFLYHHLPTINAFTIYIYTLILTITNTFNTIFYYFTHNYLSTIFAYTYISI